MVKYGIANSKHVACFVTTNKGVIMIICIIFLVRNMEIINWIIACGVLAFGVFLVYLYHKGILQDYGNGADE